MKEEMETIKLRSGNQLARENYLLLNKSKAQILNILLNTEEKMEDLQSQLKAKEEVIKEIIEYLQSKELNNSLNNISQCCSGRNRTSKGYIFKFKNDKDVLSKYKAVIGVSDENNKQ